MKGPGVVWQGLGNREHHGPRLTAPAFTHRLTADQVTLIRRMTKGTTIGGFSEVPGNTGAHRQQTVGSDGTIGHAGELVTSLYLFGTDKPWLDKTLTSLGRADHGDDFIGVNIEVKTRRWNKGERGEVELLLDTRDVDKPGARDRVYILVQANGVGRYDHVEVGTTMEVWGWCMLGDCQPIQIGRKMKHGIQAQFMRPLPPYRWAHVV